MPGLLSWVVKVIRDSEYEASDVVPGPGSNVRHPLAVFPSLHRVPAGPVPRLHQYYEGATTSSRPSCRTSLPSFGSTSVALDVSLLDSRVLRRGLELFTRSSNREYAVEACWISQVLGESQLSVCTCSHPTPAGLLAPDHKGAAAWPLVCEKQRLPRKVFRSSIAWLSDWLRAPSEAWSASQDGSPRHHARLASGRWSGVTARAFHPQGSDERFQSCELHLIPLSQALLGTSTSTSAS